MREPTAQQKARNSIIKNVIKGVLDSEDQLKKVDAWRAAQDPEIDQFEAIRWLVDLGLKAKPGKT